MLGHPGGEQHSRYLIELAFLEKGTKWLNLCMINSMIF